MDLTSDYKPSLYLRYVDDIFCVFQSTDAIDKFFKLLNSLHPNLEFTSEIGNDNLSFLDTSIFLPIDRNSPSTSTVYRKPTNTNVILNYSAICPQKWKLGLITCFLNRAYVVCSNWSLFHDEVAFLKSMFKKNGYPQAVFESCVNKFLSKKKDSLNPDPDLNEDSHPSVMSVPYFAHISVTFKKQLRASLKHSSVVTRFVFKSFRVGNYFSLKDRTPLSLRANVVYQFQCSCDKNASYIGKTKRHLSLRTKEHLDGKSAISTHLRSCTSCQQSCDITDFHILSSGSSDFDIKIKEALLIKSNRPFLNTQLKENGASFLLNIF